MLHVHVLWMPAVNEKNLMFFLNTENTTNFLFKTKDYIYIEMFMTWTYTNITWHWNKKRNRDNRTVVSINTSIDFIGTKTKIQNHIKFIFELDIFYYVTVINIQVAGTFHIILKALLNLLCSLRYYS
jgi:hypothetical protein